MKKIFAAVIALFMFFYSDAQAPVSKTVLVSGDVQGGATPKPLINAVVRLTQMNKFGVLIVLSFVSAKTSTKAQFPFLFLDIYNFCSIAHVTCAR